MPSYVKIYQGSYGVFTPNTPNEYAGFCTEGLITCSAIAGTAMTSRGNAAWSFFCHADNMTDLLDAKHGPFHWLSQVPSRVSTELLYSRPENEDPSYAQQLMALQNLTGRNPTPTITFSSIDSFTDANLDRNAREFDTNDRIGSSTINLVQNDELSIFFTHYPDYVGKVKGNDGTYPPICIFNGDRPLRLREILDQRPDVRDTCIQANIIMFMENNACSNFASMKELENKCFEFVKDELSVFTDQTKDEPTVNQFVTQESFASYLRSAPQFQEFARKTISPPKQTNHTNEFRERFNKIKQVTGAERFLQSTASSNAKKTTKKIENAPQFPRH
jgi:hypothetical protein